MDPKCLLDMLLVATPNAVVLSIYIWGWGLLVFSCLEIMVRGDGFSAVDKKGTKFRFYGRGHHCFDDLRNRDYRAIV